MGIEGVRAWMRNTFSRTIFPLFIMTACPAFALIMWYTNVILDGSPAALWSLCMQDGFWQVLCRIWAPYWLGSPTAWAIIVVYGLIQLFLMKVLPGKPYEGPVTPTGHVPVYKANGVMAYWTTLGLFCGASWGLGLFSPTIIYDHFPSLIGALNLFSLFYCVFLYVKGRWAPSTADHGTSGNVVFDYYWGTELFPRVSGWDLKMFTNCRFGMMAWPLIILSFAAKQEALYGLSDSMVVAVGLQLLYVSKFFLWETGYLSSLDIMYDRAGFYICWGCLVWVPSIYTSPTLFLVNHPHELGVFFTLLFGLLGTLCILGNFAADRQRQVVRAAQGQCQVWGRDPVLIKANYRRHDGSLGESLLLASGWWGIARHFHYVLEVGGAFFWTVPALFTHGLPYFYVVFLTILLIHRSLRDERRCSAKYGEHWDQYCSMVPYRMIPYLH